MSDKTNQATPTPKQKFIDDYTNRRASVGMLQSLGQLYDERVSPLLAENEKLRKEYDECFELMRKNLNDFLSANEENEKLRGLLPDCQKFLDLKDVRACGLSARITAALSGEQEGTPLK